MPTTPPPGSPEPTDEEFVRENFRKKVETYIEDVALPLFAKRTTNKEEMADLLKQYRAVSEQLGAFYREVNELEEQDLFGKHLAETWRKRLSDTNQQWHQSKSELTGDPIPDISWRKGETWNISGN